MYTRPDDEIFMVRAAQAVLHRSVPDRRQADELGQLIVDYAVNHWDSVYAKYEDCGADALEVVTCLTKDLIAARPEFV